MIYEYVAEALESLPVNADQSFLADLYGTKGDAQGKWAPDQVHRRMDEIREYLMTEISLAYQHQDRALKAMDFEIEAMKARADANGGRLPPYVLLGHVLVFTSAGLANKVRVAIQQIRLHLQHHGHRGRAVQEVPGTRARQMSWRWGEWISSD